MSGRRPSVWLVSPAWRRFDVTRLALEQREHLTVELAARGIDCRSVIVADDENLEIAREYGCDTVEMDNEWLGRRFNAGFQHAARQGADWLVHIGSDDWLHPDAFDPILDPSSRPAIVSGRQIAFVDLLTGRMSRATLNGFQGVIPWIVPRALMEPCDFAPIRPERNRGMDGYLVRGLRRSGASVRWVFHDPNPVARVDFKSAVNINPFAELPAPLRRSFDGDAWVTLAEHYPPDLVALAHTLHLKLAGGLDAEDAEPRRPDRQRVPSGHGGAPGPRIHRPRPDADDAAVPAA